MEDWRFGLLLAIMILCVLDMALTYYYVIKYKQWQPDKPYKLMEKNPLLRFLWNTFGLHLGMAIGFVIIVALNYIVARYAHWSIVIILFLLLMYTMINHYKNITLLFNLIDQYPSGHLPEKVFGKVVGNKTK